MDGEVAGGRTADDARGAETEKVQGTHEDGRGNSNSPDCDESNGGGSCYEGVLPSETSEGIPNGISVWIAIKPFYQAPNGEIRTGVFGSFLLDLF